MRKRVEIVDDKVQCPLCGQPDQIRSVSMVEFHMPVFVHEGKILERDDQFERALPHKDTFVGPEIESTLACLRCSATFDPPSGVVVENMWDGPWS